MSSSAKRRLQHLLAASAFTALAFANACSAGDAFVAGPAGGASGTSNAGGRDGTSGTSDPGGANASGSTSGNAEGGDGAGAGGQSSDDIGSGAAGASSTEDGGNAGESGAAGAIEVPCDTTKNPSEASCLVADRYAVFVAPTGNDRAAGSKAAPVKSLAKALELAGGSAKFVLACDGTFDEQLVLTATTKLYGGFACPGSASVTPWTYEMGKRAKVAPSARGLALRVTTGSAPVVIEDFEFDAQGGLHPGESSVAAFVNASTSVLLTRVKLVAGKGLDGESGTLTPVMFPAQTLLDGKAALGDVGGPFTSVTCPDGGSTRGGTGGSGGPGPTAGGPGTPVLSGGQAGVLEAECGVGGAGLNGASADAQPPAMGALGPGTITSAGWNGTPGGNGSAGAPGQGGGGGTGAAIGGGGGGGGAGGCGGAPGMGGKAGGSSIALLVLNSTITLKRGQLTTNDAGKGGDGIAGQEGQMVGGNGGVQVPAGCPGGKGGAGGRGGAGGGAAGGVSVGIVYQATKLTTDTVTTTVNGMPGAKGIGGVPGTNDGIAGLAQQILALP